MLGWGSGFGALGSPRCESAALQEERSRSEHNLINIQKTHERMQTENKSERAGPRGGVGAGDLKGAAGWGFVGIVV